MTIETVNWALRYSPVINATERLILAGLADHGGDGTHCYPSKKTLAEYAMCSVRSVHNHLTALESRGVIQRGDQDLVDRKIPLHQRPVCWELVMTPPAISDTPRQDLHGVPRQHPRQDSSYPRQNTGLPSATLVADEVSTKPTTNYKPKTNPLVLLPEDDGPEESSPELFLLDIEVAPYLAARAAEPSFEEFYAAYPRHVRKDSARKAWTQAVKRVSPWTILHGAERYEQDPNRDPEFTPHPATWLNGGGWDDEPCTPRTNGRERIPSGMSSGERAALQALEAGREIAAERAAAATNHHQQIGTGS